MADQSTVGSVNPVGSPIVEIETPGISVFAPPAPEEFGRFEQLTGQLLQVPKAALDEQLKR